MSRVCREVSQLQSAYVDGALDHRDRELVVGHLLGCPSCRAEVDELRALRRLLGGMAVPRDTAPDDLSARLVSIAGPDAGQPVWSRPFRRTDAGVLPSGRRSMRVRATASILALTGLVAASGVAGYVAAPVGQLAAVGDPSDRVRSEFAATMSELPLLNRSVNALMASTQAGRLSEVPRVPAAESPPDGTAVTAATAVAALQRSADQNHQVHYLGTQMVRAAHGTTTVAASVRVRSEPGQGSAVTVLTSDGRAGPTRFMPAATTRLDDELLSLLQLNYHISGWRGQRVLGRPVTVVEASAPGGGQRPAARWWVDDASGLLLRQETYDGSGEVALAAEFTELTISDKAMFMEHLAPRLAMSSTPASVEQSQAAALESSGWFCSDRVAGLSLVRMRSDEGPVPQALHQLYSDGIATLSVFQQRGTLAAPPAGSYWDETLQAHLHRGVPSMATWASADTVFTVATDGSEALLRQAVLALPHEAAASATTMGRVQAGWAHIRERVTG